MPDYSKLKRYFLIYQLVKAKKILRVDLFDFFCYFDNCLLSQIGDEYFCYITECKDPKACTILLRGASKDVLMETERNLQDALHVARNIMLNPKLVPGGGAVEMAVSHVCT